MNSEERKFTIEEVDAVAPAPRARVDLDERPAEKLERKVGTVQQVLIDAIDGELAIGRSKGDAPEIDGTVQIQDGAAHKLKPGQFVDVRIMGADEHDLFGLVAVKD